MTLIPNKFRKPNLCPYCGYFTTAAFFPEDESIAPTAGDLSLCLMCCECSEFDENMNLIKFNIDTLKPKKERIEVKLRQKNMRKFWKLNPHLKPKRDSNNDN